MILTRRSAGRLQTFGHCPHVPHDKRLGLCLLTSDASGLLFVLFASSEWLLMLNVQVTQLRRADQLGSGHLPSAAKRSQWSCLCVVVIHTLWSWDDVCTVVSLTVTAHHT